MIPLKIKENKSYHKHKSYQKFAIYAKKDLMLMMIIKNITKS